jgi:hypothetical protein
MAEVRSAKRMGLTRRARRTRRTEEALFSASSISPRSPREMPLRRSGYAVNREERHEGMTRTLILIYLDTGRPQ